MNKINTFNKIVGTILIILLIAIILRMAKMDNILHPISTGAIIVTAIIILLYTIETRRLREETHKLGEQSVLQTEIQIRPVLVIIPDEKSGFAIKNIGNGIALNVEAEDIAIRTIDVNKTLKVSFDKIDAMSQNEEMRMPRSLFTYDKKTGEKKPANDLASAADFSLCWYKYYNHEFRVKYENINGKKYQTVGTTGKDGVHIKKIGRV